MPPKFPLGRKTITPNALHTLCCVDVMHAVVRHAKGDWGDLCMDDAAVNERALLVGGRLFSVYHDTKGTKFYVITEADRSVTTVLLPEDY